MADRKKSTGKAKKGKEKEEKDHSSEENEKPEKKKKEGKAEKRTAAEEKPAKKKDKAEKSDKKECKEPHIDTIGKAVTYAPGGKLLFQCLEAKDVAKKPVPLIVHVDIDEDEVFKSKPTKGDKWQFEGRPEYFTCPDTAQTLIITLHEQRMVGNKFKGEIRLPMESLYNGYPFDQWFDLANKEGKEGDKGKSKINGALKLRLLYTKDKEPRHDEFKYPLHSLIHQDRLDIFQRKLDEVKEIEGSLNKEDDKKHTPVLLAATLGRAGFFKLLVEAGANVEDVDGDGRNAAHLAALNGHPLIIQYLGFKKKSLLDAHDQKDKKTPLHLAAEANHGEAVSALIEAGVDVNPRDTRNDTPLTAALLVEVGAKSAILALVKGGADLYAKNTMNDMPAWEMATNKEVCYAVTSRLAFLQACDVIDPREFEIAQKFPKKNRIEGKNLSTNWETATQFILTAKEGTKVSLLGYSKTRTDDCIKQVAFCVVKNSRNERTHKMPTFQQEGMGFGSTKPFEFTFEQDVSYNIMTYCTKEELAGDFLLCIFSAKDAPDVKCIEAKDWSHTAKASASWKGAKAAGSGENFKSNPQFQLTVSKGKEVLVMVRQVVKDVAGVFFAEGGHRIVPSKFYIGFYVHLHGKEIDKTEKWVNSYDVYKFLDVEPGTTYTIIPCTQKEGQEMDFEVHAFSASGKVTLSAN